MLNPHATGPRDQWSPQYLCECALDALLQVFLKCTPGSNRAMFMQKIYNPIRGLGAGGDAMVSFLKGKNEGKFDLTHLIQICCAYCIQAQAAAVMQEKALARSFLIDAYLYLGMAADGATSGAQVELLRAAGAKDALSSRARQTAAANAVPWDNAKAEATRLIRERAKAGERWATPSKAARAIAAEVEKFLTQHSPRRFQSPERRNITVAKWLREMPEAEELFASVAKASKKS